jgi:hypothetical protein
MGSIMYSWIISLPQTILFTRRENGFIPNALLIFKSGSKENGFIPNAILIFKSGSKERMDLSQMLS